MRRSGGGARSPARTTRRHVRRRQRPRSLPVHVLAGRRRVVLRAPRGRRVKGVADWRMLRRKVPDEVFAGRRTLPHELFGRDDVDGLPRQPRRARSTPRWTSSATRAGRRFRISPAASVTASASRRGAGPARSAGGRFDTLADAFDVLDGAESFVHPDAMAAVAKRRAMPRSAPPSHDATALVGLGLDEHPAEATTSSPASSTAWEGEAEDVRRTGIAHDVVLVHIASMSNLFAALGWAIVDLLEHPTSGPPWQQAIGAGGAVRARVDPARAALDHVALRAARRRARCR